MKKSKPNTHTYVCVYRYAQGGKLKQKRGRGLPSNTIKKNIYFLECGGLPSNTSCWGGYLFLFFLLLFWFASRSKKKLRSSRVDEKSWRAGFCRFSGVPQTEHPIFYICIYTYIYDRVQYDIYIYINIYICWIVWGLVSPTP